LIGVYTYYVAKYNHFTFFFKKNNILRPFNFANWRPILEIREIFWQSHNKYISKFLAFLAFHPGKNIFQLIRDVRCPLISLTVKKLFFHIILGSTFTVAVAKRNEFSKLWN